MHSLYWVGILSKKNNPFCSQLIKNIFTAAKKKEEGTIPRSLDSQAKQINKGISRVIQEVAFKELLCIRALKGGKASCGHVKTLAKRYNYLVTRDNINYCLKLPNVR